MADHFPLRPLVRVASRLLTSIAAVLLIILVGEVIVSGFYQTLWWLSHRIASVGVTLAYFTVVFAALRFLLSFRAATLTLGAAVGLYSCGNKLKLLKLGLPVSPSDLTLSHQYLSVVRIVWGDGALWCLYLLIAVLLAAIVKFRHGVGHWILARGRHWLGSAGCALAAFALIYIPDFSGQSTDYRNAIPKFLSRISVTNFNWIPGHNLKENGQLLSFLFNIRSAFVEPPVGYGRDSILKAFSKVPHARGTAASGEVTDIVVVMNEAFWDPNQLPGVHFSDPLLSNLRATSQGRLFSPVFGGYTANTEFEFLTRLSNAYLPSGTVPYTQFIRRPLPSFVTALRSAGYFATAIHPFEGGFYERNRVYRELGFDQFIALDGFTAPESAGPYVKDASVAREIATLIDASPKAKHFIFAVTMQNHGAYSGDKSRYPESSRVRVGAANTSLAPGTIEALQTYSTGVRDAVTFFNDVIKYFEDHRRNAVVVMFGDHLPGLGNLYGVYRETGFIASVLRDDWSLQELERMHTVPVVAWTNVGHPLRLPQEAISPIYLATLVKRAAGVRDGRMDLLLDQMLAEYPVVTRFYSSDPKGMRSRSAPPETATTRLYRAIQYDLLFGSQYSASKLDEQVAP